MADIFFVPGLMGSSLVHKGPSTSTGDIEEIEVWGESVGRLASILGRSPSLLASNLVSPSGVMGHIRAGKVILTVVYADLLAKCNKIAADCGHVFHPFPYDWREDLNESSAKFSKFIIDHTNEGSEIRIVTHSMGGLVARLALLDTKSIEERTTKLVQIASPLRGSAKIVGALKGVVSIHPLLDSVIRMLQRTNHELAAGELLSSIQGFPSFYQLLPPSDLQLLSTDAGQMLPATDSRFWPAAAQAHLSIAEKTHVRIRSRQPQTDIRVAYSASHPTVYMQRVDLTLQRILKEKLAPANGDETVVADSAYFMSPEIRKSRHLFDGKYSTHMELCRKSEVLDWLETELK